MMGAAGMYAFKMMGAGDSTSYKVDNRDSPFTTPRSDRENTSASAKKQGLKNSDVERVRAEREREKKLKDKRERDKAFQRADFRPESITRNLYGQEGDEEMMND